LIANHRSNAFAAKNLLWPVTSKHNELIVVCQLHLKVKFGEIPTSSL